MARRSRRAASEYGDDTDSGVLDTLAEKKRALLSRLPGGARRGALANTQTYLGMAEDSCTGRLQLEGEDQRLRVDWPRADREAIIGMINQRMRDATAALGGTYVPNPLWSNHLESCLITVHPLGGCCMGEDESSGVTNHKGQVFVGNAGTDTHAGLYVADGSVMPLALGVNPLLTITAIAERSVALLAEERGWTIEYALDHRPSPARKAASPGTIGVLFTERMAGFMAPISATQAADPDDPLAPLPRRSRGWRGRRAKPRLRPDPDRRGPRHDARRSGQAHGPRRHRRGSVDLA